ncbi:putative aminohydrolase SsnA [bacterium CPR1]|nr:putative aminohydrolase SsnA [bacterium CPR1]
MSQEIERYLLTNATVVTLGAGNRVLQGHGVLVDGAAVARLAPSQELEAAHRDIPHVDMRGMVVMPGNINAHDHLYSALARGIAMTGDPPQNFLQILERLWWRLDAALSEQDVYYSALLGFVEAVKRGTTTIIDHHASPGFIEGSLDALARAARQVGLRGCFCYEVTDRHGEEGAELGIQENLRFLERCRAEQDPYLRGAFGLHASFTVNPLALQRSLEHSPGGTFFHVHVAEDYADVVHSHENYKKPPLQRLLEEGLKDYPVLAAHCIHLEEPEYRFLESHDVTVLHNPESNMNNAVGVAQVRRILAGGGRLCLGTDGMTQDMFQEIKVLPLSHRQKAQHPQSFSYDEIYRVAYENNPALAERFFGLKLGRIEEGGPADLIALKYDPPTPFHDANFMGHLLFGLGSAPVDTTIIGGRVVVRNGQVSGVDEVELAARCRELAAALWSRW